MMPFIHNIQSVAKYESKLLVRSWFFRIFSALALFFLGIFNMVVLLTEKGGDSWALLSIPSNIPYFNLLMLNTGQAIIAIFLASDFLKRDKKLDTSEVFYVHSLSNAEYVIGKIWGNLRVFILLNFIIMGMAMMLNLMTSDATVDWMAYPLYFFLISIPTLIFIIGFSIFLMLIIKNQALTFVILLGYIGLTLFYISDKFYYVFDYMVYYLPLLKSTIVGMTNYEMILNHRAIYLFAGLAFIFFTVTLFGRLPNSKRSNYPWMILGFCTLLASIGCGYHHVNSILEQDRARTLYTMVNNKYVHTPKMAIEQYTISVEQRTEEISSEVLMQGVALKTSREFAFCLNPGLEVSDIQRDGKSLKHTRDHQIVLIDMGEEIRKNDTISLSVSYHGRVDDNFCYLDIPKEVLEQKHQRMFFNVDKKYAFQTSDYVLFTPETYWYPRPGTAYSDETPDWQQTYFSKFTLKVKTLPGLTALSQGERTTTETGSVSYTTDYPAQALSLIIGRYRQHSLMSDSILFSTWYIEGHDFFTTPFDSIRDTIPAIIKDIKQNVERNTRLAYPFKRFSVIEVPAQFYSYARAWSQAQEVVQPEMVLFPEKGWKFRQFMIQTQIENQIEWTKYDNRSITEEEAQIRVLNGIFNLFTNSEGDTDFSSGERGSYQVTSQANPYYIFPQLYNFRYNIFSSQWPVANRVIELYLQRKSDNGGWERNVNGISNNEKSNLLMEKHAFKELIGQAEYSQLLDNIISIRANDLFAKPEINIGVEAFRDSLYALLERNSFRNVQFECLLDTLGLLGQADLLPEMSKWEVPTPLPYYTIGEPKVNRFRYKEKETFVLKLPVTNNSRYDGIINLNIQVGGWGQKSSAKANRKIELAAGQSKLLVSLWEEAPREVIVNTMTSNNLPNTISLPIRNIENESGKLMDKEGDFVVAASTFDVANEIVVDNEDSLSFSLSQPAVVGLLPKWLDKVETTQFKYAGISWWRAPIQWTANTNNGYYGRYIRSAYVIKNGNGNQTATWKVPLTSPGHYEVFYWNFLTEDMGSRRSDGEYHFTIAYNNEKEDAFLAVKQTSGEWKSMGVFYFDTDAVSITLHNDSELRIVIADAVKLVKR